MPAIDDTLERIKAINIYADIIDNVVNKWVTFGDWSVV